jgi:uncharacterized protein (DUF486 family)
LVSDEELKSKARQKAEKKLGFYIHLSVYVCVNILLVFVWYFTSYPKGIFPWFVLVIIFWGVGLVAHWISVFAHTGYLDKATEQENRKLKGE